jgi:hypothetical protein
MNANRNTYRHLVKNFLGNASCGTRGKAGDNFISLRNIERNIRHQREFVTVVTNIRYRQKQEIYEECFTN